jgi:hypothetical protein
MNESPLPEPLESFLQHHIVAFGGEAYEYHLCHDQQ